MKPGKPFKKQVMEAGPVIVRVGHLDDELLKERDHLQDLLHETQQILLSDDTDANVRVRIQELLESL